VSDLFLVLSPNRHNLTTGLLGRMLTEHFHRMLNLDHRMCDGSSCYFCICFCESVGILPAVQACVSVNVLVIF